MRNPDDIVKLPRHERRRLKLARKPRSYTQEERGPFDRQMLLECLREAGTRSWRKYQAARNRGDPTVNDLRKEFGAWSEACNAAFGKDPIEVNKLDCEYIYQTILQFNLRTLAAYLEARKIRPDVLPSKHRLLYEWGTWSNVKEHARRYSIELLLNDYIKLWRRLGKKPTLSDCREERLVMDKALKFYGGKKKLDEAVASMRRHE